MRKLIIQIPCYNEERQLPATLAALPRSVPGFDCVEWLVVDDGSTDRTADVAVGGGVDHVVRLPGNRGLATAFRTGIREALALGADVIVNTDADNQYCADDIPALVLPIVEGRADLVVGARPIDSIAHFSTVKKWLQRLGSGVVRAASNTEVPDAPSGFRALSREAALRINIFDRYTYTLEMIIQAGQKGMHIASVPVRTNPLTRPSRLIRSIPGYVARSMFTILRIFMVYQPLRFFALLGALPFAGGVLLGVRWVWYFVEGAERTRIPSLILAAILLLAGLLLWVVGLLADLQAVNRRILEEVQVDVRRLRLDRHVSGTTRAER